MNINERFEKKVKRGTGDECWEWQGSRTGSGYGQFWDGKRLIQAHWFLLENRPLPGQEACHHCDNRLCVRPSHIFLGTKSDNMRDMVKKGRHNREAKANACRQMLKVRRARVGEENHYAKLSDADASLIKAVPKAIGRGAALARHFNVSQSTISLIWLGKRWTHVAAAGTAVTAAFLKTLGLWKDEEGA